MSNISLAELVVMVVEPSATQRRILRRALQDSGITTVLESDSGQTAISAIATDSPDVVISAMYLPDMSAVDLVHQLRASPSYGDTPFILVSSETRFRYLDPIRQAGVAGILPKPFSPQQLRTALATTLDLLAEDDYDEAIEDMDLRVLVVDDSAMSRKHISRILESLGIAHIDHAEDGVAALECINSHLYDFIVTDYNMPRMDGRELIDRIRHDTGQASIPVLMVTSEHNTNRLNAVQQCGVSAICDKPFEPALVKQLVREIIGTELSVGSD
jgi:two-component system chemotaxis response regulator CheY